MKQQQISVIPQDLLLRFGLPCLPLSVLYHDRQLADLICGVIYQVVVAGTFETSLTLTADMFMQSILRMARTHGRLGEQSLTLHIRAKLKITSCDSTIRIANDVTESSERMEAKSF